MTRDQLIETMARALAEHDGRDPDAAGTWFGGNKIWVDYESDAKAALTALEAAGMRVVPLDVANAIHRLRDLEDWEVERLRQYMPEDLRTRLNRVLAAQEDSTSE